MTIKASDVKALRERTGAGMMACKKALTETNNDLEKAIDLLRKAGAAKAQKAASRTAAEGLVVAKGNLVLEGNCETDFAAKNEDFIAFVNTAADLVLEHSPADLEALMGLPSPAGEGTLENFRQGLIGKVGENICIRRFELLSAEHGVGTYCHRDRIGVLVQLDKDAPELARDIAMHIAAINPEAISSDQISAERIDRERQIYLEQAKESGKPEEIAKKMVDGRLKKFLREISLVNQSFVKDPDVTIEQMLKKEDATVISFVRYELGEGIEKETVDFRTEVMQQMKGGN